MPVSHSVANPIIYRLVPVVPHGTKSGNSLSSHAPGAGKMRDPGNEVEN